jgi:hypothetical protein
LIHGWILTDLGGFVLVMIGLHSQLYGMITRKRFIAA